KRQLTLVQPSVELRERGLDPARLDPAARARIREDLFGRYLETVTRDGQAQDQLTCELTDFVRAVRTGTAPRVTGHDGRAALAVAERILESIKNHVWTGASGGPTGPNHLPTPLGTLIPQEARRDAA